MNLLIVDDDRISSFVNTRMAQKTGLFSEIRSVHNGKDALEIFLEACKGKTNAPDLVLLDLDMPGMKGFDLIEAWNSLDFPNKGRLEIVILTSSDNKPDVERAQAMGIRHYLAKSVNLKDLQATIFSLVNRAQNLFKDGSNNKISTLHLKT